MAKSTKRPRESAPKSRGGSDFVVVNPSLLRATEAPAPKKAKKDATKKEPKKADAKEQKPKSTESKPTKDMPKSKPSGVYHCDVCDLDVTMGAKAMHEQGKKHQRALASSTTSSGKVDAPIAEAKAAAASSGKADVAKAAPAPTSVQYVHVSRPEDFVGAVYALFAMHSLRHALVVVPNKGHALLQPQLVAGALKHLGFTALAVHAKTPATQRLQTLEKFRSSSSMVLVATEHLAKGLASPSAVYVSCTPSKSNGVLYVVLEKDAAPASDWSPVTPWNKLALQKASSRAAMAKTIHELTTQDVDNEAQWIQKLASASGLDADDVPKTKPLANHQKLAAVAEKLFLHMGYPLTHSGPIDLAGMKAKMTAVGLHVQSAATGMSLHATRLSAQTQWLDAASGAAFGGEWDGSVRHGASKDATSLQVRAEFCGHADKTTWQPNPKPSDATEWGGPYGKPCGHNEVVMHRLRPFFPQEVLNARICSREKPAPGNDGYDGCLEHLKWRCVVSGRAMTVWDAEQWVFLAANGDVRRINKTAALHLPLPRLKWTMANFRDHTLRCEGQIPPAHLLQSISYLGFCGGVQQNDDAPQVWGLPRRARQMIVGYLASGSPDQWTRLLTSK